MAVKPGSTGTDRPEGGVRPAKLFIGGITRHTTTKQLRDHFSRYGRVLDCVAMRQPDGRPRGFGYVTLDSPAAADRCLAEPQIIDSRVVDMKRAVPEGSGTPTGASAGALGHQLDFSAGLRTPHSPLYAWLDSPSSFFGGATHMGGLLPDASSPGLVDPLWPWGNAILQKGNGEVLDCVELLSRRAPGIGGPLGREAVGHTEPSVPSGFDQPLPLGLHSTGASTVATLSATGVLSASAPEFVPAAVREPATGAAGAGPESRRMPLGELTNITNILNNSKDAMKAELWKERPTPSPLAVGRLSSAVANAGFAGCENRLATQDAEAAQERSVLEIREDTSDDGDDAGEGDTEGSESSGSDEGSGAENEVGTSPTGSHAAAPRVPGPSPAQSLGPLPSTGSAEHAAGTCKRCNFFPKGRCQNGANCTFCHFPHDKRKPSRQEKRDRRAAWLSQRDGIDGPAVTSVQETLRPLFAGDQETKDECLDVDDVSQRTTMAYSVLPGMPPIRSVKLPAPLPLPGNGSYKATAPVFPCLPPGLPPPKCGLELWQPDEEVSPLRFGLPTPTSHPSPVLATVPLAPATPQSIAASTTTSASAMKATSTIGTQTIEDLDYPCPRCCDAEPPTPDDDSSGENLAKPVKANARTMRTRRGRTWQREELLRLRGAMQRRGASMAGDVFGTVCIGAEGLS